MVDYSKIPKIVMSDTEINLIPIPRPTKDKEYKASDLIQKINGACKELREKIPEGWKAQVAGSIRRKNPIVHDLDVAVCILDPVITDKLQKFFREKKEEWEFHSDFRYCTKSNYGATMLYLTGNAEHNIQMRIIASNMGFLLNEYGLFTREGDNYIVGRTEKGIYKRLGLCYIPPGRRSFMRYTRFLRQSELGEKK